MPRLKVPPDDQQGLIKLQALSDATASGLLAALRGAASKSNIDEVRASDLPDIGGLPKNDADRIVETVTALYHARAYFDAEKDDFISDVFESMKLTAPVGFQSSEESLQKFRNRLVEFLSIEELTIAAKSSVLRNEQERAFRSCRILTDARPIFGDEVNISPKAAVIMHNLKVAYYHAGKEGEAFFALDEEDLKKLKKAIERAESKAASLRTLLAGAHVKVFNLG